MLIHDWPTAPSRLRIVELRREYGVGFNVWILPVKGEYRESISRTSYESSWSVPSQAMVGDLLLYYRAAPDKYFKDVFVLAGPVRYPQAGWKKGGDWMGSIRRVCTLKSHVHLSTLQQHPVIKDAGFVRGCMRFRYRASAYWPELYRLIIDRNPGVVAALRQYGPERVA